MDVTNVDQYIKSGIKVVINPGQEYFDQYQERVSKTDSWNFRRNEYKLWLSSFDKYWMYMAIDEENDKVICCVALALQRNKQGEALYSVGNYYCVTEWRGKGISNKLFGMMMEQVGTNNCTLFGAEQMSPLYASRYNFAIMNEFWHYSAEINTSDLIIPNIPDGHTCKTIEEHDWEKLHEYDENISNMERRKYMKMSLSLDRTISRLVRNDKGEIVGFGAIRMVYDNELVLCPLYADNLDAAVAITSSLLASVPNISTFKCLASIYPEVNNDVSRLYSLISNGKCKQTKEYCNQYTQKMMTFPQNKIFATDECAHCPC